MYQNQYYRRMILMRSLKRDSSENLINKTWLFTAIEQRVHSSSLCLESCLLCCLFPSPTNGQFKLKTGSSITKHAQYVQIFRTKNAFFHFLLIYARNLKNLKEKRHFNQCLKALSVRIRLCFTLSWTAATHFSDRVWSCFSDDGSKLQLTGSTNAL